MSQMPAIDKVTKTSVSGIFEVRAGGNVYYTDAGAEHLFAGVILNTRTQKNLTEAANLELAAEEFRKLPVRDAITIVKGTGKRSLVVFSDPNCPYCKQLEPELARLENVTIRLFLYPILGADSVAKSKAIWCAADQAKAWEDWMIRGLRPPTQRADCGAVQVERNAGLGRRLKMSGTPALMFADGKVIAGAASTKEIETRLHASALARAD